MVCANFGKSREGLSPCEFISCGPCYTPHRWDKFKIQDPADVIEGELSLVSNDEERKRFREARPGDHTMRMFQCDTCQFQNCYFRNPNNKVASDELAMCCIRRANLDAFWSREPATVRNHVNEVRFQIKYGDQLNLDMFEELGPWELGDHMGMKQAIGILLRSREPGRNGFTVKFSTTRKARGVFTRVAHASPTSKRNQTFAKDRNKLTITHATTYGEWFSSFMEGVLARMGQITRQDRAISIEEMLALQEGFEKTWNHEGYDIDLNVLEAAVFALTTYVGSLRGYETVKIHLPTLIEKLKEASTSGGLDSQLPYYGIPLIGRFKTEAGERAFVIPMASETASGLQPLLWTIRLINKLKMEGEYDRSWMLAKQAGSSQQAGMNKYEKEIFGRLRKIQKERPDLIPESVDVDQDYGLARMFRRGATTRARIAGVNSDDINAQNRWRSEMNSRGKGYTGTMKDLYTDFLQSAEMLLRFSRAL